MKKILVLGIAGGTGSGKTTITRRLVQRFGSDISTVFYDSYYRANHDIPFEERTKINYDHPNAFDTDIMIDHIKALAEGKPIERPVYDFTIHNRVDETVTVYPAKVIVVEGILIFENAELRDLCDIKVFIDTDADVRIIRRILRDVQERGRMLDNIVDQYLTTVKPMHEMFVEPSKKYADIIIPEGGFNQVAFEMLAYRIHALLRDHKEQ